MKKLLLLALLLCSAWIVTNAVTIKNVSTDKDSRELDVMVIQGFKKLNQLTIKDEATIDVPEDAKISISVKGSGGILSGGMCSTIVKNAKADTIIFFNDDSPSLSRDYWRLSEKYKPRA